MRGWVWGLRRLRDLTTGEESKRYPTNKGRTCFPHFMLLTRCFVLDVLRPHSCTRQVQNNLIDPLCPHTYPHTPYLLKNMCSVRHSPIPSAPLALATTASGVSTLDKTPSRRKESAWVWNCGEVEVWIFVLQGGNADDEQSMEVEVRVRDLIHLYRSRSSKPRLAVQSVHV